MNAEKMSTVPPHTAEPRPAHLENESVPGLLRGLAHDLTTLFSKELALAKAEVREAAGDVKAFVASVAVGAALAFAGLVITLLSAVYGLTLVLEPWLAALIVGVASLLIGFMLIKGAQARMKHGVTPERTIHSMQKDKATLERAAQ